MDEVKINNVRLIPYENKRGEIKSFIVVGIDTYPHREQLKSMNGIWMPRVINPMNKIPGVWGFSLSKKSDVIDWANSLNGIEALDSIEDNLVEVRDTWLDEIDKKYLLLPLVFKIPSVDEVINGIDEFDEIGSRQCKNETEKKLLRYSIKSLKDDTYGEDEIVILYKLLDRYYKTENNRNNLLRDSFKHLSFYLDDPLHNFLFLMGYQDSKFISFNNEKFQQLFDEVVRDNIVTSEERKYLEEKAEYYAIDKKLLAEALIDPKLHNSSFHYLVNEVCEDGIVTEAEHSFILEKANEYNFNDEEVEVLLAKRLRFYKLVNSFKEDSHFQDLLYEYLFLAVVDKSNPNLRFNIRNLKEDSIIETFKRVNTARIEHLKERFFYRSESISIRDLFKSLEFDLAEELQFSESRARVISDFNTKNHVFFKGFHYYFEFVKLSNKSIFNSEVVGNKIFVKINVGNSLFGQDPEISKSTMYLLITLIATKTELYSDNKLEHFFDLWDLNQKHLSRQIIKT